MALPLVICVGNPARGDDGVAHEVARLLRAGDPGLDVRDVHALDVVLAEDAARAALLVVVDAVRRDAPAVTVGDIEAGTTAPGAHSLDPAGLLGIARSLYGAAPRGLLVGVAAPDMPHAETLSSTATQAAREAAETVSALIAGDDQG